MNAYEIPKKQLYDGIPKFTEEKTGPTECCEKLLYENVKDPNQVAKNAVFGHDP